MNADEREWSEELVERLARHLHEDGRTGLQKRMIGSWDDLPNSQKDFWCERAEVVLNTIASDPEAKRAILGEPVAWMVEVRDPGDEEWVYYGCRREEDRDYVTTGLEERWVPLYAIEEPSEDE